MTKPKAKQQPKTKFLVVFQDGFKKEFEATSHNDAAAKARRWAESPASNRGGKIIVLNTYAI